MAHAEIDDNKMLILPIGLPRSGKSTWSRSLAAHGIPLPVGSRPDAALNPTLEEIFEDPKGAMTEHRRVAGAARTSVAVVNPDSIRQALYAQHFIPEAEPVVWAQAKIMVRALFLTGYRVVILDATNISARERQEWRSPAWELAYQIFGTTPEVCEQRARKDGREDLIPVIRRMAEKMTIPSGLDQRHVPTWIMERDNARAAEIEAARAEEGEAARFAQSHDAPGE